MMDAISPGAILISIISLTILFLWDIYLSKKYSIFKLIQGPLVAVIAGIGYEVFTLAYMPEWSLSSKHLVNVPVSDNFYEFFGQFTLPTFSAITDFNVWSVAVTIAIVASLETLLSVEATDKMDPYNRTTDTSRELIAQGCGNFASGLIGGLPVTQVILRSSANIQSGAKSRMSAIMHGIFLLLCVVLIPHVLNRVPLAVLACILLVIGFKLASPSIFRQMAKLGWTQFVPFMATIIGVVFTDLLIGIGIGFCVSIVIVLRDSYYNSHFLHRESVGEKETIKLTLAEQVVFLNKGRIKKELSEVEEGAHVTIDMQKSVKVDYDVLEIIEDFTNSAKSKNISVELITEKSKEKKKESESELTALEIENW
jgi:MFS superfamily sulfate permease-like transporter